MRNVVHGLGQTILPIEDKVSRKAGVIVMFDIAEPESLFHHVQHILPERVLFLGFITAAGGGAEKALKIMERKVQHDQIQQNGGSLGNCLFRAQSISKERAATSSS